MFFERKEYFFGIDELFQSVKELFQSGKDLFPGVKELLRSWKVLFREIIHVSCGEAPYWVERKTLWIAGFDNDLIIEKPCLVFVLANLKVDVLLFNG